MLMQTLIGTTVGLHILRQTTGYAKFCMGIVTGYNTDEITKRRGLVGAWNWLLVPLNLSVFLRVFEEVERFSLILDVPPDNGSQVPQLVLLKHPCC